jgi:hypothetical protein
MNSRCDAGERQQGERARGREALVGGAERRRVGLEERDQHGVPISLAGLLARRAFGVHHALRRWRCGGEQVAKRCSERADECRVFRLVAECGNPGIGGVEPRAAEAARAGNDDALDRRDGDALPHAQPLEDQPACIGKRERTKGRRRGARVDERDAETRAAQGKRCGAADRTCTADDNVNRRRGHRASAPRCRRRASAPRR